MNICALDRFNYLYSVYKTLTLRPRSKEFGPGIYLNAGTGDKLFSAALQSPLSYVDYDPLPGAFAPQYLQGRDFFLWRTHCKVPCTSVLRFSMLISR